MLKHQMRYAALHDTLFEGWNKPGVWVCGGAARGYALNEPINDLDFFFDSPQTFVEFYDHILGKGVQYVIGNHDERVVVPLRYGRQDIQLYRKEFFPNWEAVVDDFDFTNCQFAVDHKRHAFWTKQGHADAINKELRAHNLKFPVVILRRINKFLAAGYEPCDGFWKDVVSKLKAIEDTHANNGTFA